jgi:hypothetical protein
MSGIKFQFDVDVVRAVSIAEVLRDMIKKGHPLLQMPEYKCLEELSSLGVEERKLALFYTYVISVDYLTDAEKLWRNACEVFIRHPEKFTPDYILSIDELSLQNLLRELGARYYRKDVSTWRKISQILIEKYGGDPRKITPQPLRIEEIKKRLNEFPNLRGDKLSNFYIRVMGETGLFKVENLNELDIAVDIQVTRFTIYTGVLRLKCGTFRGSPCTQILRDSVQKVWRDAAKTVGVAPWELDEPIWTIGSKLCTNRKTLNERTCLQSSECPVNTFCDKTVGVIFKKGYIIWGSKPC